jgi:hypothetical protein
LQVPEKGIFRIKSILPFAWVGELKRPLISPIPETEATSSSSVIGKEPPAPVVKDPAEKPSHCKSFRVTLTEMSAALSSEMVRPSVPLLAFPLIWMGPLKVIPGNGVIEKSAPGVPGVGNLKKSVGNIHQGVSLGVIVKVGLGLGVSVAVGTGVNVAVGVGVSGVTVGDGGIGAALGPHALKWMTSSAASKSHGLFFLIVKTSSRIYQRAGKFQLRASAYA